MSWDGLNPEFARRLNTFIAAAYSQGIVISLGSGYRNIAQQQKLYNDYINGVPGQARAAPPGKSNHNHGLAGDLEFGAGGREFAHANAQRFGLFFPMGDEPWHIEGIGLTGGTNNAAAYPSQATVVGPQQDPFAVAMSEIEQAVLGDPTSQNNVIRAPAFDLVDDMGNSLTQGSAPSQFPGLNGDPAAAQAIDPATGLPVAGAALNAATPGDSALGLATPMTNVLATAAGGVAGQPSDVQALPNAPAGGVGGSDIQAIPNFLGQPGVPEPLTPNTTLPGGSAGGITSSGLMAAAGPNGVLPPAAIAAAAAAAGFTGEDLVTAVAVGLAESSGRITVGSLLPGTAASGDGNLTQQGETSAGIWQINFRPSRDMNNPIRNPTANADPLQNARNAFQIYQGAGGTFTDWTTFNQGQYQSHMATARQAVAEMGQYANMLDPAAQQIGFANRDADSKGAATPSANMGESFVTPFRRDRERQAAVNADRRPAGKGKRFPRRATGKDI